MTCERYVKTYDFRSVPNDAKTKTTQKDNFVNWHVKSLESASDKHVIACAWHVNNMCIGSTSDMREFH